jgi:plastocyanin
MAEGHGANGIVDETNCLASGCHVVGSFGANDGSLHGEHNDCAACHDGTPAAGNVFASSCVVCHPVGNVGACPLVNQHEAAGADCLSCHSTCQAQAEVAIEPATVTLNPGDTQTFTASTTGGDNPPAYTWEVEGGSAGTGNTTTGDSIEYTAGNTPGNYTITVTDTANGNIQATAAVTIEAEVLCTVTVKDEEVLKSHWVARPALIQIQTTGIEVSQATGVAFVSNAPGGALKSIIPLVKLVNADAGIIYQLAIISPAIFTGNFDAESETITVAVEGCTQTDTFDLKLLYLGPIPLSK